MLFPQPETNHSPLTRPSSREATFAKTTSPCPTTAPSSRTPDASPLIPLPRSPTMSTSSLPTIQAPRPAEVSVQLSFRTLFFFLFFQLTPILTQDADMEFTEAVPRVAPALKNFRQFEDENGERLALLNRDVGGHDRVGTRVWDDEKEVTIVREIV